MTHPHDRYAHVSRSALAAVVLFLCLDKPARSIQIEVVNEEVVTRYAPANNGAGPLWCYGSPLIVRRNGDVFVSTIETGEGVPPLCNTRWQLWQRRPDQWQLVNQESSFRQREPCPLVSLAGSGLFLSANPSSRPPGTQYGPCRPTVLAFASDRLEAPPSEEPPVWLGEPRFTDHSYRGFAADGERGELLLLNIDASTSEQFVSFRDKRGVWHAKGKIRFPIRAAYPQVALRRSAAHVLAIGDIREPVEQWRRRKYEQLKRDWDYVFRRLFYTFTKDVTTRPFSQPIEVDTVEQTAGHITNLDLHVDQDGTAHVLYLKRPHLHAFLRDRFFPGEPMTVSLEYAVIQSGRVVERQTLAKTGEAQERLEPGYARFHVAPAGRLYVVLGGTVGADGESRKWGNFLQEIKPTGKRLEIELAHPFRTFFTSSPRGGCKPSTTIDLFGIADDAPNLRYAEVRLQE